MFVLLCFTNSHAEEKQYEIYYFSDYDYISPAVEVHKFSTKDDSEEIKIIDTKNIPYTPFLHSTRYEEIAKQADSALVRNKKIANLINEINNQFLEPEIDVVDENLDKNVYILSIILNKKTGIQITRNYYIACYYNMLLDTVVFIDSEYHDFDNIYRNSMIEGRLDSLGNNYYYRKNDHIEKYDISKNKFEQLYDGLFPIIPQNSSNILMYSSDNEEIILFNSNLEELSRVSSDYISPISTLQIEENKYLITCRLSDNFLKRREMEVRLYDFSKGDYTIITTLPFGFIINVVSDPK